jgi:hypothetical protein
MYADATTNNIIFRDDLSKAKLIFNNSDQTYTFPASSGTIALTSDLSSYVTLATTQTISGLKKFDASLLLKDSATISTTAGYLALNFVKASTQSSLYLTSDTGFTSTLAFNNAASYNYTFPAATGTLALGTGTTNYHAKFTGASTLGNSLIWDNGTNVGIGNTNTSYTLDVSGTGRFTGALSGTSATFSADLSATNGFFSAFTRISGVSGVPSTGQGLELYYNSGTGLASVGAYDRGGGVQKALELQASTITLKSGGNSTMTLTSGGNVGIGTSTGNGKLIIKQSSTSLFEGLNVYASTNDSFIGLGHTGSLAVINSTYNSTGNYSPLAFYTSDVDRGRFTSNGYFKASNFAGYTSYLASYHQLFQNASDWITEIANYNAIPYGLLLRYGAAAPRGGSNQVVYVTDTSGAVFSMTSNGNCYNLNNVYTALSDIKLKENIVDASPKLDKLLQVRIRNFNLKTDPNLKQIGVIPQELQEVFPKLIEETFDRDIDGKLNGETSLGVKYSVFVPILIKAVQEQNQIIQELSNRLIKLESK